MNPVNHKGMLMDCVEWHSARPGPGRARRMEGAPVVERKMTEREPVLLEPLPGNCVVTLARERYWKRVDELMRRLAEDDPAPGLEEEVETLRAFLETADVAAVRRETEEIMESGRRVRVALRRISRERLEIHVEAFPE